MSSLPEPPPKESAPISPLSIWSNPVTLGGLMLFIIYELGGLSAFWAETFDDFTFYSQLLPLPLLILTTGVLGMYIAEKDRVGYGNLGNVSIIMFVVGFLFVTVGSTVEFSLADATSFDDYTRGGGFVLFYIGSWGMFLGSAMLLFATLRADGEPRRESTFWIIIGVTIIILLGLLPSPTLLDFDPNTPLASF